MKTNVKAVAPPGDPGFFRGFFSMLRSSLSSIGEEVAHPYEHSPWVYASNQAIAIPISSLPFRIMKQTPSRMSRSAQQAECFASIRSTAPNVSSDKAFAISHIANHRQRAHAIRKAAPWLPVYAVAAATTNTEVVESGPWVELFERVNPQMTRSQLWEATLLYLGTDGECMWELVGKKGPAEPNEVPVEIMPRGSTGFTPTFDENGTILTGWIFESQFKGVSSETGRRVNRKVKVQFTNDQVVHYHYFHPRNPVRGMSPLDPVREEIEQGFRATRFNTLFFKNGATVGGLLNIKSGDMSPDEQNDLLAKINQKHVGEENSHKTLVINGAEAEFKEMTSSQRDMQFIQLQNQTRDTIMAASRVSKSALGLVEDQNRANLLASQKGVWETTLIPKAVYIEDLLNSDLFTLARTKNQNVFGMFDLSEVEALQENFGDKIDHAEKLHKMSYPINLISERLELGVERVEWGDTGYLPSTLSPVGGPGFQPPPAPTQPAPPTPADDKTTEAVARITKKIAMQNELWVRKIENIFEPAEALYKKKYRKFLSGVRSEQLAKIANADTARVTVPDQLLFDLSEQQRKVEAQMEPVYRKTFDEAEADAVFEVQKIKDVSKQVSPSDKEAFIRVMGAEVQITVRTMRNELRSRIALSLANEETAAEMEAMVRSFFSQFTGGGKLGTIARTETATTINTARTMTFKGLEVAKTEWVTAGDELVRDTHVTYGNGGKQPIDFNWAELSGGFYTLKYPLDPVAPLEERINCRCVLIPA